jgi:predicted nucleic acid-binding protein
LADTLVLDTNAFSVRGFAHFLGAYDRRKVLPAVAAAELFRHLWIQRGWSEEQFFEYLGRLRVTVEPLHARAAVAAVLAAGPSFSDRTEDNLIAAHALSPGRTLVTANIRHYPHVPVAISPVALLKRR